MKKYNLTPEGREHTLQDVMEAIEHAETALRSAGGDINCEGIVLELERCLGHLRRVRLALVLEWGPPMPSNAINDQEGPSETLPF